MPETVNLKVKIIPNAPKNSIVGYLGDSLKIKIKAVAVDNKANVALVEFLAEKLEIPKSHIEIVHGQTSRIKILKISGEKIALKISNLVD